VFISYTEAMTVIDVDKELGIAKVWYVQRRCSELIFYCIVMHFLEQQPAKNCLGWCTVNEVIRKNIRVLFLNIKYFKMCIFNNYQ